MADYSDAYQRPPEPSREDLKARIRELEDALARSLEDKIRAEIREVLEDAPLPIDYIAPLVQHRLTIRESSITNVFRKMWLWDEEIEEVPGCRFIFRLKEGERKNV